MKTYIGFMAVLIFLATHIATGGDPRSQKSDHSRKVIYQDSWGYVVSYEAEKSSIPEFTDILGYSDLGVFDGS